MSIHLRPAWFVLHFLLVLSVSCRETLWLIGHGMTLLPAFVSNDGGKTQIDPTGILGQNLAGSNVFWRTVVTYTNLAGIDAGYGYFAPNIPDSYRLSFELHYPDGRVEHILPPFHSFSGGLRMASLLDEIGRTNSERLREHMVKMMAQSLWRTHPEVKTMRASLEKIISPSAGDFQRGARESLQFLYGYDFSLVEGQSPTINR